VNGAPTAFHSYVLEKSDSLNPGSFTAITDPSTNLEAMIPNTGGAREFYRVRLVNSPQ
jgi:hypothetical protein